MKNLFYRDSPVNGFAAHVSRKVPPTIDWDALKQAEQSMLRLDALPDNQSLPSPNPSLPSTLASPPPAQVVNNCSTSASRKRTAKEKPQELDYLENIKQPVKKILDGNLLGILSSWEVFERSKGYPDKLVVSLLSDLTCTLLTEHIGGCTRCGQTET